MRRSGLRSFLVFVYAGQIGCGQPRTSQELLLSMEPMDLLKEVGKSICDPGTIHIVEESEVDDEDVFWRSGTFEIYFGPEGEYRLETDRGVIVHDGRYVTGWIPEGIAGGPKYDSIVYQPRINQPRMGPHRRYPGDLVMAAGMGQACDGFTPYMRLLGADWMQHLPFGKVLDDGNEICGGHRCRKIATEFDDSGKATFWVDISTTFLHKYTVEKNDSQTRVRLLSISVDPPLKGDEFVIPEQVFENSRVQSESGLESRKVN